MKAGRLFTVIMFFSVVHLFPATDSSAFWGFGEDDTGRSGLDFEQGYDLNTETTVRGKVVSVEPGAEGGPIRIAVKQGRDTFTVVAAPEWYWSDRGISVKPDDDLEATGSKAQGRDGRLYLISRSITNHTEHETVTLRDEIGRPGWRGGNRARHGASGGRKRMGGGRR